MSYGPQWKWFYHFCIIQGVGKHIMVLMVCENYLLLHVVRLPCISTMPNNRKSYLILFKMIWVYCAFLLKAQLVESFLFHIKCLHKFRCKNNSNIIIVIMIVYFYIRWLNMINQLMCEPYYQKENINKQS